MLSRRRFLQVGAAAAAAPVVGFPAVVKLRKPNELLSHACIGTGMMLEANFLKEFYTYQRFFHEYLIL